MVQLFSLALYTHEKQKNIIVHHFDKKHLFLWEPSLGLTIYQNPTVKNLNRKKIQYDLLPAVIQLFGTRTIRYLALSLTGHTEKYITELLHYIKIEEIIIHNKNKNRKLFYEFTEWCYSRSIRVSYTIPEQLNELLQKQLAKQNLL